MGQERLTQNLNKILQVERRPISRVSWIWRQEKLFLRLGIVVGWQETYPDAVENLTRWREAVLFVVGPLRGMGAPHKMASKPSCVFL